MSDSKVQPETVSGTFACCTAVQHCPQCDYDLRGHSRTFHCPECGLAFDETSFAIHSTPSLGCVVLAITVVCISTLIGTAVAFVTGQFDLGSVPSVLIALFLLFFVVVPLSIRWKRARYRADVVAATDGIFVAGQHGAFIPWEHVERVEARRVAHGVPPLSALRRPPDNRPASWTFLILPGGANINHEFSLIVTERDARRIEAALNERIRSSRSTARDS